MQEHGTALAVPCRRRLQPVAGAAGAISEMNQEENEMNIDDKLLEILRTLGHIEGRLDSFGSLFERVSAIEQMQSWLKGAWAVLVAAFAYLFRREI
jgi:hypothetical protein